MLLVKLGPLLICLSSLCLWFDVRILFIIPSSMLLYFLFKSSPGLHPLSDFDLGYLSTATLARATRG